jgi:integrase
MTIFRATGRAIWTVKIPDTSGEWLPYSTGTTNQATARRIERMVEHLGPRGERAWDLLWKVHAKELTVPALYDRYAQASRDVAALRRSLAEADLEPMVQQFLDAATCSADTKAHYKALIRRLVKEGEAFPADNFTAPVIQQLIDTMEGSAATKRKAGAAFRTFGNWLVRRGIVAHNPVRQVKLPRAAAPRTLFLETADAKKLADAQPSPYREFSALLAGSGIEVSVALALRVRDVDKKHREIRAAGTKTHARDRIVRVADWAWPYVMKAVKGKGTDDLLFLVPDRWVAGDAHRAAIAMLEQKSSAFAGYTMRDHRHTYAVRAIRAGTPADLVARQLGHANPVLVLTTYGRFQPNQDERGKWEKKATAMDRARTRSKKKAK